MPAKSKSGKSFKARVASIPVVGPMIRQSYRKLTGADEDIDKVEKSKTAPPQKPEKTQGNKTKSPAPRKKSAAPVVHNLCPIGESTLSRKTVLDGNASFSNSELADTLVAALRDVATHMPVVVFPADRGNNLQIGLPTHHSDAFRKHLSQALGADLIWDHDTKSKTAGEAISKKLKQRPHFEMTLDWGGHFKTVIRASLYHQGQDKLDSRDSKNRVLRHIHTSLGPVLKTNGLHDASDMLGGQPLNAFRDPVDVVYTWVNHDDLEWQKMYASAKGLDAPEAVAQDEETDAESLARFTNRNELQYSIRSIEQYMPWVRKIYVFTNCACPDWITPSEKLVWMRHEDVIAPEHLPTFNSHAIEASLHKIPDLAENFIYFNDDFFINEAVPRSFFFSPNNISNANLEDYGVVNGDVNPDDKDYLNAARNGAALLKKTFGRAPTQLHKHTPYAMKRSIIEEMELQFPDEVNATRAAQFRSSTDVSVASFLYHHYSYCTGRGTQAGYRSKIIKNTMSDLDRQLAALREGNGLRVFCINDGADSHTDAAWNKKVPAFLANRFPIPVAEETQKPG